jgi:uncharacterized protein
MNLKQYSVIIIILFTIAGIIIYTRNQVKKPQLANPASVYCKTQGGMSVIITAADGSQSGNCKFTDGRNCDEWQFFREHNCLNQNITPSPLVKPIIKDKVACDKLGGKWGKVGLSITEFCNLPLTDGGKSCTDNNECKGECLANLSSVEMDGLRKGDILNNQSGFCTAWETVVGCKARVIKGNVNGLLCVD